MLTVEQLKEMNDEEIFAKGQFMDNEYGINVWNSDHVMDWVAVRGTTHDWAIYYTPAYDRMLETNLALKGDKLLGEDNIRRLVNCDDDSYKMYRR